MKRATTSVEAPACIYILERGVKRANPRKQAPRLQLICDEVIIWSLRDRIAPYPSIWTSQRILLARIMLKCSYRTRDLKFDERTG